MGKPKPWREHPVASAPTDSDFARAGVWRIRLTKDALSGVSDVFLQIRYTGDVARLYAGSRLLDDDFFNGAIWEVGLKRFAAEVLSRVLELKVLPLRKDSPIYIPGALWPSFPPTGEIGEVREILASPEYELLLNVGSSMAR